MAMEDALKREKDSTSLQHQAVISWLRLSEFLQEDELDENFGRGHPGTCDWITRNSKMRPWLREGGGKECLWLHGKPGSGSYLSFPYVSSKNITDLLASKRENCAMCEHYSVLEGREF